MRDVLLKGNHEICMLWCRRFGKTEALVITAITLAVYYISRLGEPFSIALVNPARNEQSIMVTKARLQERLDKLDLWLGIRFKIRKILGDGRKTPDYILHCDESGREIRIELEFESASFEREHAGQAEKCDLVVCWRDTWGRAATKPVLELAGILY
jgi:hypothetical protein